MAHNDMTPPTGEIFPDQREAVCETVCDAILSRASIHHDRPYILGVNGIDASGKTQFSLSLAARLAQRGQHVQIVHIDDFNNPHAARNASPDPIDNYYYNCFDSDTLINSVLRPARTEGQVCITLNQVDAGNDDQSIVHTYEAYPGSILLVEGVFLFRPELSPYFDYRLFLDVSTDTVIRRAEERDVPRFGVAVLDKYRNKYLPAQQRYIEQVNPASMANMVIDNTDWQSPVIIKQNQGGQA
jgi:uridine kinase